MLIDDIERYIALRRSLGFKLQKPSRHLQSFARFATEGGESHVRAATAVAWAATAPTPEARHRWLGYVVRLARFLRAEEARTRYRRRTPSPHQNCGLFPTSTRGMNWPAYSKPPDSSVGKSRTPCGGNFM